MKALSLDLRERIVAARLKGLPVAEVADQFEVSPRTVRQYSRLARLGRLSPQPIPGKPPRLKPEQEADFLAMIQEYPNFTLEQYSQEWERRSGIRLPKSTLHDHLQRLGGRFKKDSSGSRTL